MVRKYAFIIFCWFVLPGLVQAQWQKVVMTDIGGHVFYVSSELNAPEDGSMGKYSAVNLFDHDPATAWVEGVEGNGAGETIITGPLNDVPVKIFIDNGFQKSPSLFQANNRLRTAFLTLMAGITIPGHVTERGPEVYLLPLPGNRTIQFADSMMTSVFETGWTPDMSETLKEGALKQFREKYGNEAGNTLEKLEVNYYIRLEIKCVYPGTKWDDTCISGLEVREAEMPENGLRPDEKVLEVFASDDGRYVFVNTDQRKNLILADAAAIEKEEQVPDNQRGFMVLMVLDNTPDNTWVQVNIIYGHPGPGRVEEATRLFHIPLMRAVDPLLIGEDIYNYYGFVVKDGKAWLDTDAGEIDLDEVYRKLVSAGGNK